VRKNPYIDDWETNRQAEIKQLTDSGKIPVEHDIDSKGDDLDDETMDQARPVSSLPQRPWNLLLTSLSQFLMGQVAAVVKERLPAKQIMDDMINEAVSVMQQGVGLITGKAKL